ncbi:MAG: ABC transporter ATP-binding protein [Terriglobia bacterium]
MSQSPLLRAESLTKIYRSGEDQLIVFEDLNLEIHEGEFVALTGESGAGKTTLLHLLAALDTPTRGAVYFFRERLDEYSARQRSIYRNRKVGFLWQMHYLLPEFTAVENVMMPGLIAGDSFQQARGRAVELLTEVGLERIAERRVGELSGGEQQRVALARALINQPQVLLADEPTGNLDMRSADRVAALLEKLHRDHGLTSVLATHNLQLAQRADRTLRLADGRLTETIVPGIH